MVLKDNKIIIHNILIEHIKTKYNQYTQSMRYIRNTININYNLMK